MHVLIVDDEAQVARVLAECVSGEGHTVTVAHRGLEALDALEHARPDVVFLDVVMPDMSGIEVLRHIRQSDADLPVMLISGRADARTLAEARGLGITDVIGKPWGLLYLDEALASIEAARPPSAEAAAKSAAPAPRSRATGSPARDTQES
jgi:CheY-like chemotaxis protein